MPISAGALNQRITFRRLTGALDELGQSAGVWEDVARNVPAQVKPVRVRDQFAAGTVQESGSIIVRVRFRRDITADMRAVWRGDDYAIQGRPIDPDARRVELEMLCGVVPRTGGGTP